MFMQKNSIKNIAGFILKDPRRLPVLFQKVFVRFKEPGKKNTDSKWLKEHQTNFADWAAGINYELWNEAESFSEQLKLDAKKELEQLPFSMGGGGIYPILYFLTRLYKPVTIVETGVAAGYSSKTFLVALTKNQSGILYSSDFPYFRIPNPEKYIGILVDDDLKKGWKLFIEGDKKNLPAICNEVEKIDLFHYDSDKSYSGRNFAFEVIRKKIHEGSILIFDDVQDNNYFKDFVTTHQCSYKLFVFQGKYVGLTFDLKI